MKTETTWKHLTRKPKSSYKQLFVKDRWVAARTLYGQTLGEDARTPEEVARDYQLPLEVVLEAIAYCESDPPEIREDWEREEALSRATGMEAPKFACLGKPRTIPPQEQAKIFRS